MDRDVLLHRVADAEVVEPSRVGDWMITYTGRRFWPLSPRVEDVSFRDIAHALSQVCRYGGHTRCFYSVAEHSAHLAEYFMRLGRPDLARFALLHDGSEAYIGDMIRPLKPQLPAFKQVERPIERIILIAAGLAGTLPPEVHDADTAIIGTEACTLFTPEVLAAAGWKVLPGLDGVDIMGWIPPYAEQHFLGLFEELFPEVAL